MMNVNNFGWEMIWGMVAGLIVLVVIIWIIVKVVNRNNRSGKT